jgi:hypothetical protein
VRYSFDRYRLALSYTHYWYVIPSVNDSRTQPPLNYEASGSNNIFTLTFEASL